MRRLAPLLLAVALVAAISWRVDSAGVADVRLPGDELQSPRGAPSVSIEAHNDQMKRGGLSLETFDLAKAADRPDVGEKMIRKLRTGLMPPRTADQPDAVRRMALVSALETRLDAAAAAWPNPGRRRFQRLNRAEYAAAIRSIFGLEIDVSPFLPADTISASFDNIADVQMPSATVMQGDDSA